MYICFWVFSSSWKEMKKKGCEKRKKKKKGADTEMGTYPFEHKARRAAQGGWARAEGSWAPRLGR